jgi:hypothetical protein
MVECASEEGFAGTFLVKAPTELPLEVIFIDPHAVWIERVIPIALVAGTGVKVLTETVSIEVVNECT